MIKKANIKPWGPCLVEMFLETNEIEDVKKLCNKNKLLDRRKFLAGHLEHEYTIEDSKLNEIIKEYIANYKSICDFYYSNKKNKKLNVNGSWVNFMQKGDFNPLHFHTECDFSGVLYLDVPNEIEKEAKESINNGTSPGEIQFISGTSIKNFVTSHTFLPKNGQLFIFPSNLIHMVCPFKSNVERVSVAFNLTWN